MICECKKLPPTSSASSDQKPSSPSSGGSSTSGSSNNGPPSGPARGPPGDRGSPSATSSSGSSGDSSDGSASGPARSSPGGRTSSSSLGDSSGGPRSSSGSSSFSGGSSGVNSSNPIGYVPVAAPPNVFAAAYLTESIEPPQFVAEEQYSNSTTRQISPEIGLARIGSLLNSLNNTTNGFFPRLLRRLNSTNVLCGKNNSRSPIFTSPQLSSSSVTFLELSTEKQLLNSTAHNSDLNSSSSQAKSYSTSPATSNQTTSSPPITETHTDINTDISRLRPF